MSLEKRSLDDENEVFLQPEDATVLIKRDRNPRKQIFRWVRIFLELWMAATIVFLLLYKPSDRLIRTPVPKLPRKIYTFHNDAHFAREDMFFNESTTLHTLHNWIPLSSASRGYVVLPPSNKKFDLPAPYIIATSRHEDGPGYMMSVFHSLHCLSYLATHFQRGYGGVALEEEVAHHSAHCFNYVRQSLTCNADTTLEGKTGEGPGEGSRHECVDYEALLEWANGHAAMRWREGLLPEESTL
ncbi:hypothetical protein BDV96DRAFT_352996 [Lophiotrema nucula]|uniref:Oxidase ustYa n=1 Tax=Lophiotrema nucula TaxID=690887 RepID=A0A6A5ZL77_9PLEO|nr:hypothetical protein BDV96DRAFT_352996 [Lophiotrema nucula]